MKPKIANVKVGDGLLLILKESPYEVFIKWE